MNEPIVTESIFLTLLASGVIQNIHLYFEPGGKTCSIQFLVANRSLAYISASNGACRFYRLGEALTFLKRNKVGSVFLDLENYPIKPSSPPKA